MLATRNQLLLLQCIIFFAFIGMTLPYPTIAPMILSHQQVNIPIFFGFVVTKKIFASFLLGIYPLGLFAGGLILGFLSDCCSKKHLLVFNLLMCIIMQAVSGILVLDHQYSWLLLSRFFSGVFEGNIVIARAVLGMICQTEHLRLKHFGRGNAALTLGWSIGPLLGGFISVTMPHILQYAAPYFFSAACNIFLSYFVYRYFSNPKIENPVTDTIQKKTVFRIFFFFLLGALFVTLGVDAFYQFLPIYLSMQSQTTALSVGSAVATVGLFNAFANIVVLPRLGAHFDTKKILQFFLSGLIFLLLFFPTKTTQQFFFLAMVGMCIGMVMTSITVLASMRTAVQSQGKLMGFLLSQRTLGTALVSFLLAPTLMFNSRLAFSIGACLMVMGFFGISVIQHTTK